MEGFFTKEGCTKSKKATMTEIHQSDAARYEFLNDLFAEEGDGDVVASLDHALRNAGFSWKQRQALLDAAQVVFAEWPQGKFDDIEQLTPELVAHAEAQGWSLEQYDRFVDWFLAAKEGNPPSVPVTTEAEDRRRAAEIDKLPRDEYWRDGWLQRERVMLIERLESTERGLSDNPRSNSLTTAERAELESIQGKLRTPEYWKQNSPLPGRYRALLAKQSGELSEIPLTKPEESKPALWGNWGSLPSVSGSDGIGGVAGVLSGGTASNSNGD